MAVMDIMIEPRRVTVFFDRRSPSDAADQRRIERASERARVLASGEAAADGPSQTQPLAA